MGISFLKTSYEGRTPIFWRGECKVLPGGFKPLNALRAGSVLLSGTPLFVDFDNLTAAVVKVAKVLAGGTTTKVRVAKTHAFAAGDSVCKVGAEGTAVAISSIDTTNAEYDVLNLASGLTGVASGDVVAEAGEGGTPKYAPNAVVAADLEVKDKLDTIDAAYEALVLKKNAHYPVLDAWVAGIALKDNPNILFINQ